MYRDLENDFFFGIRSTKLNQRISGKLLELPVFVQSDNSDYRHPYGPISSRRWIANFWRGKIGSFLMDVIAVQQHAQGSFAFYIKQWQPSLGHVFFPHPRRYERPMTKLRKDSSVLNAEKSDHFRSTLLVRFCPSRYDHGEYGWADMGISWNVGIYLEYFKGMGFLDWLQDGFTGIRARARGEVHSNERTTSTKQNGEDGFVWKMWHLRQIHPNHSNTYIVAYCSDINSYDML